MTIPNVDPSKPPTPERLSELSDDEIYSLVRWWSDQNYAVVGMQFWLDELSRRRTERGLAAISKAAAENARQIAELTSLTEASTEQTSKMVAMTARIEHLTTTMVGLAIVSAAVAIIALVVAVVSLVR